MKTTQNQTTRFTRFGQVLVLLAAILVGGVVVPPAAQAETEGDFTYTVEDDAATITEYSGSGTANLTIPATLGSYPTSAIGRYAFYEKSLTGTLTLPDGVELLDEYAFEKNPGLTSVVWGTSQTNSQLISIGDGVFARTGLVGSLGLPNSLKSIGGSAFSGLSLITSISFGSGPTASQLETIGASAFSDTGLVGSLVLPNSLKSIGGAAFNGLSLITSVSFGSGPTASQLERIETSAFYLTGLTGAMNFPDSLKIVDDYAFSGLTGITSVSFGSSQTASQLETIGAYAFEDTGLTGTLVLPDSVQTVGIAAFLDVGTGYPKSGPELSLSSGISTSSLEVIEAYAFDYPAPNTSLVIPDSVTRMSLESFGSFASLKSLTFGAGTDEVGEGAFAAAPLTSIVFTGNRAPTEIANEAFRNAVREDEGTPTPLTRWQGATGWGDTGSFILPVVDGVHEAGGEAWPVVIAAPTVTSIDPTSGTALGNTFVRIYGTGFATGATVSIGGVATSVNVVSSREITARTPDAGGGGTVGVTVTNPRVDEPVGTGAALAGSLNSAFTFLVPGGGGVSPAPESNATSTPVPIASPVPVVVPVPTELKPGVGSLMIDGVVTPVTVAPSPDGKELIVSGGGVRLVLNAVGPDGKALPLARDGSLVLSQSGGLPMVGSGFAAGSTVTLFMFSTPVTLGSATANATGGYATDVVIPAATATGSHTIQVIGTTASGQPIVLSIGVTVKTAIAARGSNPRLIVTRTHNTGSRFVVEARGVQASCNVKFWVKGSTVNTQSGAAGKARATLKAPGTKGNWVVTATTQGTGCDRVTTSTRVTTK